MIYAQFKVIDPKKTFTGAGDFFPALPSVGHFIEFHLQKYVVDSIVWETSWPPIIPVVYLVEVNE